MTHRFWKVSNLSGIVLVLGLHIGEQCSNWLLTKERYNVLLRLASLTKNEITVSLAQQVIEGILGKELATKKRVAFYISVQTDIGKQEIICEFSDRGDIYISIDFSTIFPLEEIPLYVTLYNPSRICSLLFFF